MSADAHHDAPAPPARSRIRRAVMWALGVTVGVAAGAEAVLQLPPVREAIRVRAEAKLAERWPGATIARCAAADVTGVVRFDGVRLPADDRAGVVLDGLEVSVRLRSLFRGKVEPLSVGAADTFVEADVPGLGKIGLGGDEGAKLPLQVIELPGDGAPARVRLSGPARVCLPSGRCLAAETLAEAEASKDDGGLHLRWQALADVVRIRSADPAEPAIVLPAMAAHGEAARSDNRAAIDASISVGPHGSVEAKASVTDGMLKMDLVCATESYAELLASIPLGNVTEANLAVDGSIGATARITGPVRDPETWDVLAKLDLASLRADPRNADAGQRFVEPFTYRASADPDAPEIWMGEANPDFLPLEETPSLVIWAVLLSEDSEFFVHPGFDAPAMVDAIKSNLREKRVRRGGSTISQQLAKNLWLSRERTLQRKLEEALLTISLEAAVPKERILEIYLNGIEWGPGIYGVRRAARHYFGKEPGELTPKEAAYLATVIPSPKRYYGYFRKGALTENWEQHVMHLIEKLRDAGYVTPAQYDEAAWTPLRFASSGDDPWTTEVETATVAPLEPVEPPLED
jgi:hypothetical protein